MKNKIIYTALLFLFQLTLFGQTSVESFIKSVEKNNKELAAAQSLLKAEILYTKQNLTPENPFVEFGTFPGSEGATGTKKVFGITQEFAFPTVYFLKAKLAKKEATKLEQEYLYTRQNILEKASIVYCNYIYLLKLEKAYQIRALNTEKMYNLIQRKYEIGNASIIDVNKAKIQLADISSKLSKLKQRIKIAENELNYVNGGTEFSLADTNYQTREISSFDSVWSDINQMHPAILIAKAYHEEAIYNVKFKKHNCLPGFEIGYEREIEPDGTYAGIKAGIEIPLWGNVNSVKQAKAKLAYSQNVKQIRSEELLTKYSNLYLEVIENKKLMEEYKKSYIELSIISFLDKAFKTGEISFLEYLNELSFLYQTEDNYLEIEKELYVSQSKLMSYKL